MSDDERGAEAEAFAPGHVTGFFEIRDDASDPVRIGSRGAGFSVDLGVSSRVRLAPEGFPGIDIRINGQPAPAATTRQALELLVGGASPHLEVEQRMDLPVSQGFGMSAAGALSSALALTEVLGRPRRDAVWAAHTADVLNRSGLGDVVAADRGGFEVRLEPGLPPYGRVETWTTGVPPTKVFLCVVAPEIETKRILSDPAKRSAIGEVGAKCLRSFSEERSLQNFANLSKEFSLATRLGSAPILRAYDEVGDRALISQCMLGGSVFVFGGGPDLRDRLRKLGPVFEARVDGQGARVTVSKTPLTPTRPR